VCQTLHAENFCAPILMCSARSEDADQNLSLQSGANDFLVKPFAMRELITRVQNLLER
jgi:DNA-binding response OmpR family regulator